MDIRAGVLTISDKGSTGERKDESGAAVARMIGDHGYSVIKSDVIPDDRAEISQTLVQWVDEYALNLILT